MSAFRPLFLYLVLVSSAFAEPPSVATPRDRVEILLSAFGSDLSKLSASEITALYVSLPRLEAELQKTGRANEPVPERGWRIELDNPDANALAENWRKRQRLLLNLLPLTRFEDFERDLDKLDRLPDAEQNRAALIELAPLLYFNVTPPGRTREAARGLIDEYGIAAREHAESLRMFYTDFYQESVLPVLARRGLDKDDRHLIPETLRQRLAPRGPGRPASSLVVRRATAYEGALHQARAKTGASDQALASGVVSYAVHADEASSPVASVLVIPIRLKAEEAPVPYVVGLENLGTLAPGQSAAILRAIAADWGSSEIFLPRAPVSRNESIAGLLAKLPGKSVDIFLPSAAAFQKRNLENARRVLVKDLGSFEAPTETNKGSRMASVDSLAPGGVPHLAAILTLEGSLDPKLVEHLAGPRGAQAASTWFQAELDHGRNEMSDVYYENRLRSVIENGIPHDLAIAERMVARASEARQFLFQTQPEWAPYREALAMAVWFRDHASRASDEAYRTRLRETLKLPAALRNSALKVAYQHGIDTINRELPDLAMSHLTLSETEPPHDQLPEIAQEEIFRRMRSPERAVRENAVRAFLNLYPYRTWSLAAWTALTLAIEKEPSLLPVVRAFQKNRIALMDNQIDHLFHSDAFARSPELHRMVRGLALLGSGPGQVFDLLVGLERWYTHPQLDSLLNAVLDLDPTGEIARRRNFALKFLYLNLNRDDSPFPMKALERIYETRARAGVQMTDFGAIVGSFSTRALERNLSVERAAEMHIRSLAPGLPEIKGSEWLVKNWLGNPTWYARLRVILPPRDRIELDRRYGLLADRAGQSNHLADCTSLVYWLQGKFEEGASFSEEKNLNFPKPGRLARFTSACANGFRKLFGN